MNRRDFFGAIVAVLAARLAPSLPESYVTVAEADTYLHGIRRAGEVTFSINWDMSSQKDVTVFHFLGEWCLPAKSIVCDVRQLFGQPTDSANECMTSLTMPSIARDSGPTLT